MSEHMAVELVVIVDVDDDITEGEMDRKAADLAAQVSFATSSCEVAHKTPWLVNR